VSLFEHGGRVGGKRGQESKKESCGGERNMALIWNLVPTCGRFGERKVGPLSLKEGREPKMGVVCCRRKTCVRNEWRGCQSMELNRKG